MSQLWQPLIGPGVQRPERNKALMVSDKEGIYPGYLIQYCGHFLGYQMLSDTKENVCSSVSISLFGGLSLFASRYRRVVGDTPAPVGALNDLGHLRPSGGIKWDTSTQVEA